jgi:hypothetical protein
VSGIVSPTILSRADRPPCADTIQDVTDPETPGTAGIELERPSVTEYNRFVIVPVTEKGEPPGGPDGSLGEYRVALVLGIPGVDAVATSMDLTTVEASGDSLIVSDGLQIRVWEGQKELTWTLQPNDRGHLATAHVVLHAGSMSRAETLAHDIVMQILSRLAFDTNTALEAKAIIVQELATGTISVAATLMGETRPPQNILGRMEPEIAAFLSAYREGLSSTTPLYKALSFYKVIEGISTHHKQRAREAARAGDPPPPDPLAATFPSPHDYAPEIDGLGLEPPPEFAGRPLREVWESYKDTVRNAAAHITPGRPVAVADRLEDVEQYHAAVPTLRYIARKVLETEIARTDAKREATSDGKDQRAEGGGSSPGR